MSVGTCHQSRARHAGWVFFSDHLSTSTYPVHQPYSTCTSSRAPAPHARSPLRTHDEHLSKENLLAVSLLTNIPRTSAGPLNAILEDQLAYLATPPHKLSAKHYFATIASACQQHCIHSGLQDRHVSARKVAPFLTVRHKRCHVLTVMQYAVLRIITLLVRLSCRHCVSLGIVAVDYLSESCILAFVSTVQICCGDVFCYRG